MSSPELSLILPVFNEARVLPSTLRQLLHELDGLGLGFEILAVDDGSTDGTRALLNSLARDDARLRVLSNPSNEGKGSALRRGAAAATGRVILTLDADLSTDLEALPRALAQVEAGAAVVIGDRRHPDSRILVRQPWLRERGGAIFNGLARVLIGGGVRDYTCGFKAYRRDAANELFAELETARWAHDAELLAVAHARGMRVSSLPVNWSHNADTKVRLPRDGFGALRDLLRVAVRRRLGRYKR